MSKNLKNYIVNLRGEKERFSFKKVYRSARRVGAPKRLAKEIALKIEREKYPGITTKEIFRSVKRELKRKEPQAALKFNLKQGMRRLGPTGFMFEKFIGDILEKHGFDVHLNQYIPGAFGRYEIDFLAKKDNLMYIGECKYRKEPGGKVHLDTALANYARFLDIKNGNFFKKSKNLKLKSYLITNAKLTNQAIRYSEGVGVELLAWNYPKGKGLEHVIDTKKLYPITILPSLNNYLANIFAKEKLMLAQDVLKIDINKFSRRTRIPIKKLKSLLKEAETLLE